MEVLVVKCDHCYHTEGVLTVISLNGTLTSSMLNVSHNVLVSDSLEPFRSVIDLWPLTATRGLLTEMSLNFDNYYRDVIH